MVTTIYHTQPDATIHVGDELVALAAMPDSSADCATDLPADRHSGDHQRNGSRPAMYGPHSRQIIGARRYGSHNRKRYHAPKTKEVMSSASLTI